jgi:hypothetical protein
LSICLACSSQFVPPTTKKKKERKKRKEKKKTLNRAIHELFHYTILRVACPHEQTAPQAEAESRDLEAEKTR